MSRSGDDDIGCGVDDMAQGLPGVPIAAIRAAVRILLHGDWIYDALSSNEGIGGVSGEGRWMCV